MKEITNILTTGLGKCRHSSKEYCRYLVRSADRSCCIKNNSLLDTDMIRACPSIHLKKQKSLPEQIDFVNEGIGGVIEV